MCVVRFQNGRRRRSVRRYRSPIEWALRALRHTICHNAQRRMSGGRLQSRRYVLRKAFNVWHSHTKYLRQANVDGFSFQWRCTANSIAYHDLWGRVVFPGVWAYIDVTAIYVNVLNKLSNSPEVCVFFFNHETVCVSHGIIGGFIVNCVKRLSHKPRFFCFKYCLLLKWFGLNYFATL